MGLLEIIFKPRGKFMPPGRYDCEMTSLFTPEGPESGPARFKVLVFGESDDSHSRWVFELTPETTFFVDERPATRASFMMLLEDCAHFTVVARELGKAAEIHLGE